MSSAANFCDTTIAGSNARTATRPPGRCDRGSRAHAMIRGDFRPPRVTVWYDGRVRSTLSMAVLALVLPCAGAGCKPAVASADECERVSLHLADLQIAKEKVPPLGHLVPPFDDKDHEQNLRDEAHDNAKQRCLKGWKRDVYECMIQAKDIDAADKCRFL